MLGAVLHPIREVPQRLGHPAHCANRFPAHLGNHAVIHVSNSVPEFFLKPVDRVFKVPAEIAGTGWGMGAHSASPFADSRFI